MMTRLAMVGILAVALAGCSLFWSSSKSSESSKGSSKSSSKILSSSSPGDDEGSKAYRDDIRDTTTAYVRSGGELTAFQRSLGTVAARHGITDWEDRDATYFGIGAGLAGADLNGERLALLASELAGNDARKAAQIENGYAAARAGR